MITTNIPCTLMLPGQEPQKAIIESVVRSFTGEPHPFRAIIDGKSYSLEFVWIGEQKLISYNDNEWWYLSEWYQAMQYYEKNKKTDWCFTEEGLEYCYYSTDFKRHYTIFEG